jgi:trehalose-6-phosphate synthase
MQVDLRYSFMNPRLRLVLQTVLIQVALQTTGENELQGGVADVVSRLNSRFSTLTYQPVVFLHTQDLTFNQYLALLTVADTFMVSSLREGMALRSHEYVECQEERKRPLILSEVGLYFISLAYQLRSLTILGTVHGNILVQWIPLVHPY